MNTMEQNTLRNALIAEKKRFDKLSAVRDLTAQLAEAVDRRDEVSVQMLLSMREEPLTHLAEIHESRRMQLPELSEETAIRLTGLLNGTVQAANPLEEQLSAQVSMNHRLMIRITDLDKRISLKLGGSQSYYNKYR